MPKSASSVISALDSPPSPAPAPFPDPTPRSPATIVSKSPASPASPTPAASTTDTPTAGALTAAPAPTPAAATATATAPAAGDAAIKLDTATENAADIAGDTVSDTAATTATAAAATAAVGDDAAAETEPSSITASNGADAAAGASENGPSPYGTRSRQRTGQSRPNYAEDKDEVEEDWAPARAPAAPPAKKQSTSSTRAAAKSSTSTAPSGRKPNAHSRRSAATVGVSDDEWAAQPLQEDDSSVSAPKSRTSSKAHSREPRIPGVSSFAVTTDAPPASRKRKAPGISTTITTPTTTTHPQLASPAMRSRHAVATPTTDPLPRISNMVSFSRCQARPSNGCLVADDKTEYRVNDFVYLVCEPPGEPYYLARIMEFIHTGSDPHAPVEQLRCNWMYRPRDINRKATDTRLVFASMHSDVAPLSSLRGKCFIQHRSRIEDVEQFRRNKDSFFFSQMYERYIHRYYDVIPTSQVINVPDAVKKVLDERWQFVVVEPPRARELTSAVKTCKRCNGYCASHDSVDCAMCKNTYHMNCVQPPLQKKPARGFAWSCGPCSRQQERRLEARHAPQAGGEGGEGEDADLVEEEVDETTRSNQVSAGSSPPSGEPETEVRQATKEQIAQARMWPWRYLGIHCKVEDALDFDDRIYPRASSRLGPRHQANVNVWHGHHIEYVKPAESRRKYLKGAAAKKDAKMTREGLSAPEADRSARERRPKWVLDEPHGFIRRGEDHPNQSSANTARTIMRLPLVGEASDRGIDDLTAVKSITDKSEAVVDQYIARARAEIAPVLGVQPHHTNFLDKAVELLHAYDYDADVALQKLRAIDLRKDLKEPRLSKEDTRRFEEAVAKFGSNTGDITRHVGKSQKFGDIVRFYYLWKKTDRGRQIWGQYEGRRNKKSLRQSETALLDDVADDADDSAFDNGKASKRKRGFECKFCRTQSSRVWRRAPGVAPGATVPIDASKSGSQDKAMQRMLALCHRCANLWRRYAISWENVDDFAKRLGGISGRSFKRKADEDLFQELLNANAESAVGVSSATLATAQALGMDVQPSLALQPEQEVARKRQKNVLPPPEKEIAVPTVPAPPPEPPKKKVPEKPPEPPPIIPDPPRFRDHPCAVCMEMEPGAEQRLVCKHCRLTVHRQCYGVPADRNSLKWICDMCSNDATNQVSTDYTCILCPTVSKPRPLMDGVRPNPGHRKKTDRDREKDRLEKELSAQAEIDFHQRQEELGRPQVPREALKATANNHWMHVVCAVWSPWIRFRNAKQLDQAEGILSIPVPKFKEACKLCRVNSGVTVTCRKCPASFHVSCAQQARYPMGFDVMPVKGSRRELVNSITLGCETGAAEAVIYCSDHAVKTILHPMHERAGEQESTNALQLFVQNFKQADSSLTGTTRKAAIINSAARPPSSAGSNTAPPSRGSISSSSGPPRESPVKVVVKSDQVDALGDRILHLETSTLADSGRKRCQTCHTKISPRWYRIVIKPMHNRGSNAVNGHWESHASWRCHRCTLKQPREPSSEPPQRRPHGRSPRHKASHNAHNDSPGLPSWASNPSRAPTNYPPPMHTPHWQSPRAAASAIDQDRPSASDLPHFRTSAPREALSSGSRRSRATGRPLVNGHTVSHTESARPRSPPPSTSMRESERRASDMPSRHVDSYAASSDYPHQRTEYGPRSEAQPFVSGARTESRRFDSLPRSEPRAFESAPRHEVRPFESPSHGRIPSPTFMPRRPSISLDSWLGRNNPSNSAAPPAAAMGLPSVTALHHSPPMGSTRPMHDVNGSPPIGSLLDRPSSIMNGSPPMGLMSSRPLPAANGSPPIGAFFSQPRSFDNDAVLSPARAFGNSSAVDQPRFVNHDAASSHLRSLENGAGPSPPLPPPLGAVPVSPTGNFTAPPLPSLRSAGPLLALQQPLHLTQPTLPPPRPPPMDPADGSRSGRFALDRLGQREATATELNHGGSASSNPVSNITMGSILSPTAFSNGGGYASLPSSNGPSNGLLALGGQGHGSSNPGLSSSSAYNDPHAPVGSSSMPQPLVPAVLDARRTPPPPSREVVMRTPPPLGDAVPHREVVSVYGQRVGDESHYSGAMAKPITAAIRPDAGPQYLAPQVESNVVASAGLDHPGSAADQSEHPTTLSGVHGPSASVPANRNPLASESNYQGSIPVSEHQSLRPPEHLERQLQAPDDSGRTQDEGRHAAREPDPTSRLEPTSPPVSRAPAAVNGASASPSLRNLLH